MEAATLDTPKHSPLCVALVHCLRINQADCHERAMTDQELARLMGCAHREVIDARREATRTLGVAILSGERGSWIERDPRKVRAYAEALHSRAKAIHVSAKDLSDRAAAMEAARPIETSGQARLFVTAREGWANEGCRR